MKMDLSAVSGERISEPERTRSWSIPELMRNSGITVFSFLLFAVYAFLFCRSVSRYWFNPDWTTDDALQQIYPFYKALYPDLFKDDLITRMMECYLAPLHYWLCYGITLLTRDPIMMGHWVMLILVLISLAFIFLAVRELAGNAAGFFAAMWLLHTRHIMQRLTAGLPRGWAAPLLCAFVYFLVKGSHRAILFLIFLGCLCHPPSTLIIALAYGLTLLWKVALPSTRAANIKPLLVYIAFCPLFAITAWMVVRMPPEIGRMASYEQASHMPEFQAVSFNVKGGRFPFVPLPDAEGQIRMFGFQAFVGRFYHAPRAFKRFLPEIVLSLLAVLVAVGYYRRRRVVVPAGLWIYGISALIVYFAARALAFRLYVPDRHLQFPLGVFFIVTVTAAVWRAFHKGGEREVRDTSFQLSWPSCIGLASVALFVVVGSGLGLKGAANFNYSIDKKGPIWRWMRANTPLTAHIAGDPTLIDGAQLLGMRQAFVTTETSHPFYDRYYEEMKRRLEISFKAFYARDFDELLALLEPEGIDYFVFDRAKFSPEGLQKAEYFPPFDDLVRSLASRRSSEYAYSLLPSKVDIKSFPAMPFKDKVAAVVDLKKLRQWLREQKAKGAAEAPAGGSAAPGDGVER